MTYQEGPESTVTHQGRQYALDTLFALVEKRTPSKVSLHYIDWVLSHDAARLDRMQKADLAVPIIVLHEPGRGKESYVVIDGVHRLAKAKALGRRSLPAHLITRSELQSAKVSK